MGLHSKRNSESRRTNKTSEITDDRVFLPPPSRLVLFSLSQSIYGREALLTACPQKYYTVNRTDAGPGSSRVSLAECEERINDAPYPNDNTRTHGRRPHLHRDSENDYINERIELDRDARREKGNRAVLNRKTLPNIYAYPSNNFDYDHQNSRGQARGSDPGYGRIITDSNKNQLGYSYHPHGNSHGMVRATRDGSYVADYKDKPRSRSRHRHRHHSRDSSSDSSRNSSRDYLRQRSPMRRRYRSPSYSD